MTKPDPTTTKHDPTTTQKYRDSLRLYLATGGENVTQLERDMHALGYAEFTRRTLYARTERGRRRPGWIERYGWKEILAGQRGRDAAAPKSSTPSQGGVAAAPADGVGTPGRLPSGRGRSAEQHPRPDRTARVSTTFGAARHTAPHSPAPRTASRSSFKAWLKRVSPNMRWDLPHQEYLYTRLKKVTDGTCKRLMIFMPPRHGKSELVTARYTAWRIREDPSMNVILGSYNQRLADRFSRKVRRVLADDASIALKETAQNAGFSPSAAGEATAATPGEGASQPNKHTAQHRNHANPCTCHPKEKRSAGASQRGTGSSLPFAQKPANTVSEWETTEGGTFRAVGVGAGVTGFGAKLIVIDDPVKSRAEAESETYRDKVHEWFNDDLYTRLEPDGAIVLIQTRWHEDDLAGRLIKEMAEGGEHWEIVDLPALCEETEAGQNHLRERVGSAAAVGTSPQPGPHTAAQRGQEGGSIPAPSSSTPSSSPRPGVSAVRPIYDPIGRLPGEALWPSRFDERKLLEIKRKLGSYSFSALYQQRPVPAEGGLFKRKWFKQVTDAPPPGLQWKRGYDLAVSTRTTSCYTASAKCAFDRDGNLYIADVFRRRIEFPDQRRYIVHNLLTEKNTEHGIELALHGQAILQDLRREAQARGKAFKGVKVDADKVTRSLSWANLAEEGKVILVRGPWIADFLDEVCRFPSGATDDQVDAVSIAVKMCRQHKTRNFWSF